MPFSLDEYLTHIRSAESAGNDIARNPRSTASGRYQFTRGTWESLGLNWNDRFNVATQETAIRTLTTRNIAQLSAAGVPINDANVYGAHFLGAGSAARVLNAPDQTPVASLVSPQVIAANPFLAGMNVGAFRQWLQGRVGEGGGGSLGNVAGATASTAGGWVATAENFFLRFGLIIIGGAVVFVALWQLLSDAGAVPSPVETAKTVAKVAAVAAV